MSTPLLPRRIDVHHHVIPPIYVKALNDHGLSTFAGATFPSWSPQRSLEIMDAEGIETALLSLSTPGVYFDSLQKAVTLARECNDYCAEVVRTHTGRFGFFAVLPMPFTEAACAEAVRALDILKADGIVLLGSTDGAFLGDPRFEPLMAELNRRQAIVFVHPNLHATSSTLDLVAPGFLVEFLCDTTRAATNLVISGATTRHPDIRWILAHAGGFTPYIAWRLSLANLLPQVAELVPDGVVTHIQRFWFDTALSPSPYAMTALKALVGPGKILFGSDFPFAPEPVTGMQTRQLQSLECFDDAARTAINRSNALALFPRLATSGERCVSLPPHSPPSWKERAKRFAMRQVVALADQARDR